MRTLFARLFLAFVLVAAQVGAQVHVFAHMDTAPVKPDGAPAQGGHCDLCVAFSAADGLAPPPARFEPPAAPPAPPAVVPLHSLVAAAEPPPFSSRAPPAVS
ncbi:MAG: hypothetical protein WCA12_08860 [Burkholderiales bacterium]